MTMMTILSISDSFFEWFDDRNNLFVLIIIIAVFAIGGPLFAIKREKENQNQIQNDGTRLYEIIKNFQDIKGTTYASIAEKCGNPVNIVHSTDANGNSITEKKWWWGNYEVVLLFDSSDICLGIKSETWY